VPAVGVVPLHHVFVEGDARVVFDGDVVVVPQQDQVAEPLRAGDGRRLAADALFEVTIGRDAPDVVVERARAWLGVGVEEPAFTPRRHRHPDSVADTLSQRPRGRLDSDGVPVLRVARRQRTPCTQRLKV